MKKVIVNSENQIFMKRIKHLFTALLLLFSVAVNAHDFEVNGIYYNITDEANKTVEVSCQGIVYSDYANEYTGNVEIPESVTYNGKTYSVTKIHWAAFKDCSELTRIIIPRTITVIESQAFENCYALKTVINYSGLTLVKGSTDNGRLAFYAENVINTSNPIIDGDFMFDKLNGVNTLLVYLGDDTNITLPQNYNGESYIIGEKAFLYNKTLVSVTIPNKVTSIGSSAFKGCFALKSMTIPNSVTSIGDSAFNGCSGLTSITIGNAVTSIGASAFSGCTGLASVEIPNSVKSIGNNSFENCSNVETLYIGSAIESIGDNAFVGCNDIYKIIMGSKKAIEANENIFTDDVYYNASLYVLKDRIYAFENRAPWNKFHIVENSFTVTFKVDGEIYKSYTLEYGTAIPVETPAKEGYTFSGWNKLPATMPAEDITVEGSFAVNYYAVTYMVDGEVFATDSIAYGSEVVLIEEPTKKGYTFSGWSEVPETMPAEDITVEGSFAVNYYTITYMLDGEVYATDSVSYGSEIVLIEEPTKEGYTFSGWNEVPATMPAEDIIVKGSFIEDATTGINQVMIDRGEVVIYDLNGLRIVDVHELKRGIYIINGKKQVKK